jgi:hypothetical protein
VSYTTLSTNLNGEEAEFSTIESFCSRRVRESYRRRLQEMPNLADIFSDIFYFWRWLFSLLGGS